MSKRVIIGAAAVLALGAIAALPQLSTAEATTGAPVSAAVFSPSQTGYRSCFVRHSVVFKADGPTRQATTRCVTER